MTKESVDSETLEIVNSLERQGLNLRDVLYYLVKRLREEGHDKILADVVEQAVSGRQQEEKERTEKEIWRNKLESED